MSSVISRTVLEQRQGKISKTGGTLAFYLSKIEKEYMKENDSVDFQLMIDGNLLKLIATKRLYNFELNDIKNLVDKYQFKTEYDKSLGDVIVFEATKNNFSLSYTQDYRKKILPASVTLSGKFDDLDYQTYESVMSTTKSLKENFDVITRPEGDLDTINVLKDPEHYKLNTVKAFNLLKSTKKVGLSITIRFNNKENIIDEIKSVLDLLAPLNSKLRS